MCGIIGYSGKKDLDVSELKTLLLLAEPRGRDSTGVATPDAVVKKAVTAREFIKTADIPISNTAIGHTRAKTVGRVSDRNSHPFTYHDMTGVHNGGISNWRTLKTSEGLTDMEVDSEIIWHILGKYGLKEGIPKLRGGMALAWLDADKRLNLYRHTNPTYIGFKEDKLLFGSQKDYLETLGCEDIEYTTEHTHYVIEDGEIKNTEDLSDYKPKTTTYYNSGGYGGYGHGSYNYNRNTKTKTKEDIRKENEPVYAPDDAKFINDNNGPVIYYWFADPTQTKLQVEPVYPNLMYEFKESYSLDNEKHIKEIRESFPALLEEEEIKSVIESQK